jgi:DNA-binding NarL/FixJ family response regulator
MTSSQIPVVLLVDPDAATHEAVAAAIGREFALLGARSAAAALALGQHRPPAVVIISDQVTDRSPAELLEALRAEAPLVRAVIVSADTLEAAVKRFASLGPVVAKPIDPARLLEAVSDMLRLREISGDADGAEPRDRPTVKNPIRSAPTRRIDRG